MNPLQLEDAILDLLNNSELSDEVQLQVLNNLASRVEDFIDTQED